MKYLLLCVVLISCVDYYKEEITLPPNSNYQCEIIIKSHLGSEIKRMSGDCDTMRGVLSFGKVIISLGEKNK